jgi:hypothetical protein
VAVEILLEASGIHPQKDALKEYQRVGIGVQPPNHPERIAEDESPESDHSPVGSLRSDKPGRGNRNDHGRPLHPIDVLQFPLPPTFASKRNTGTDLLIKHRHGQ